jgi:hypothetical protein
MQSTTVGQASSDVLTQAAGFSHECVDHFVQLLPKIADWTSQGVIEA